MHKQWLVLGDGKDGEMFEKNAMCYCRKNLLVPSLNSLKPLEQFKNRALMI